MSDYRDELTDLEKAESKRYAETSGSIIYHEASMNDIMRFWGDSYEDTNGEKPKMLDWFFDVSKNKVVVKLVTSNATGETEQKRN